MWQSWVTIDDARTQSTIIEPIQVSWNNWTNAGTTLIFNELHVKSTLEADVGPSSTCLCLKLIALSPGGTYPFIQHLLLKYVHIEILCIYFLRKSELAVSTLHICIHISIFADNIKDKVFESPSENENGNSQYSHTHTGQERRRFFPFFESRLKKIWGQADTIDEAIKSALGDPVRSVTDKACLKSSFQNPPSNVSQLHTIKHFCFLYSIEQGRNILHAKSVYNAIPPSTLSSELHSPPISPRKYHLGSDRKLILRNFWKKALNFKR